MFFARPVSELSICAAILSSVKLVTDLVQTFPVVSDYVCSFASKQPRTWNVKMTTPSLRFSLRNWPLNSGNTQTRIPNARMCCEPFETAREHCRQRMTERYCKRKKITKFTHGGKATLMSRWANTGGEGRYSTHSPCVPYMILYIQGVSSLM